jgi:hypothetical protein
MAEYKPTEIKPTDFSSPTGNQGVPEPPKAAAPSTPTLTSKNVPRPAQPPPNPVQAAVAAQQAAEMVSDDAIVAKPLTSPDFIAIKHRNPMMSCRWGNRVAGGGQRIDTLLAQGFQFVKPEDAVMSDGKTPAPKSLIKENKVIYNDLVLVCLPRVDYVGAIKHNENRARQRADRQHMQKAAIGEVDKTLREVNAPADLRRKIQPFIPSEAEMGGK